MAINIQKLIEAIQTSIGNATPATPTRELEILTKGAFKWGDNQITSFDSDGAFLDSATTSPYLLAYHTGKKNIYAFDSGSWQSISGTVAANQTQMQGTTYGYDVGGVYSTGSPSTSNTVNTYSFASDGNATSIASLGMKRLASASTASSTHGYVAGGRWNQPATGASPPSNYNPGTPVGIDTPGHIQKHSFSSNTWSTIPGQWWSNVNTAPHAGPGTSPPSYPVGKYKSNAVASPADMFLFGGIGSGPSFGPVPTNYTTQAKIIMKFPFSSDTSNATSHGNLSDPSVNGAGGQGVASSDYGYRVGSNSPDVPTSVTNIEKFPFPSNTTASDVADLVAPHYYTTNNSSTTHGFAGGSFISNAYISSFAFANENTGTDWGDLTAGGYRHAAANSTSSGYHSGGRNDPDTYTNVIQKFPFESSANATDVGDLTVAVTTSAGFQE